MRILSSPCPPLVATLGLAALLTACNVIGSQTQKPIPFSLEYRLHRGLDCARTGDCGFLVEVTEEGGITRFEDTGSRDLTMSLEGTLSLADRDELLQLLNDTDFFSFPDLLPTEDPRAGGGTVSVLYIGEETEKRVVIMKGSPLPGSAWHFMEQLETFFNTKLE